MSDQKTCDCPLCGTPFDPASGVTAEEHLALGVLAVYKDLQAKTDKAGKGANPLPCPRCGYARMKPGMVRNSLSRHYDIYICPECGNDEAYREYSKSMLALSQWWAVREVLSKDTI
jgi:predicted RNA-binding Zn-ribbon protein involved in translation (DUF1610 family)